ncbi:MAG: ArsA-related P-loop ATPase [Pseudomonadota bacterium]
MTPLETLVRERHVICVVGPGGVGKTTTAAALGVCAARAGRRSLIITIDPARRLATAMGLAELAQVEREVRVPMADGTHVTLHAMMLDLKLAWDDMVRRLSRDKAQQERILGNRFYHYLSTSLAGAQEYIACEQLYTLCAERDYDLIVLDTPPSAHAIDFLEAPGRILDVLENEALRLVVTPSLAAGRASLRLLDLGSRYVARSLTKMAGVEMLQAIADFLLAFEGMYGALKERTLGFRDIFTSPDTAFVVVATPAQQALAEAVALGERLAHDGLPLGAVVLNQIHLPVAVEVDAQAVASVLPPALDAAARGRLAGVVLQAARRHNREVEVEALGIARSLGEALAVPRVLVPRLGHDVHDMKALVEMADQLCPVLTPTIQGNA